MKDLTNEEIFDLLINEVDVDAKGGGGKTALMWASFCSFKFIKKNLKK